MYNVKTLRRVALGAALSVMMAVSAAAQTKVLVVDSNKVVTESEVGKHVKRQVETIGNSMTSELKAQASPLKSNNASLEAELKGKSQAEQMKIMQSRPDLQKKYTDMLSTEQKVVQEAKVKKYELGMTETKAKIQIAKKVQEIIEAIARERGAELVLDKSTIIYGGPSVDITDAVLSRLNSQMTRISVVRERVPRTAGK